MGTRAQDAPPGHTAPLTSAVPPLHGWGEGEGGRDLPFGLWAQGFTLPNETGPKHFKM